MGMTAGEVQLILKARDEASKAIQGLRGNISGLSHIVEGARSAFGGLAGVVAGGAVFYTAQKAVRALAGELSEMISEGMKAGGIRDAFQAIASDSGKVLAAFRQGTAGMVTDIELMRTYNNAATGVSKTFAEQLPQAMTYLRKVSAATGESMDYMLNSLVTGVSKLSPMILDNLKIQVDLTDAYGVYAASVGKSVDALSKSEQQTAVMNAVIEKLRQNTASMPDVVGNASQSWAAFKTDLANARGEIAEALVPILRELTSSIIPKVSKAIIQFGKDMGTGLGYVQDLAGVIRDTFSSGQFQSAFDLSGVTVNSVLLETTRQIGLLIASIDMVVKQAGAVAEFVKGIKADIDKLKSDPFDWEKMKEQGRPVGPFGRTAVSTPHSGGGFGGDDDLAPWNALVAKLKEVETEYNVVTGVINNATSAQKTQSEALRVAKNAWGEFQTSHAKIFSLVGAFKDLLRGEEEFVVQSGHAAVAVSDEWERAANKIKSDMQAMLSSVTQGAMSASKGLFDFGTGPENLFTPGANGPFEDIFRAQDIAVHGGSSPWAAMLGLTQEDAQKIVSDFQQGLFTEDVKGLIDMPALADQAKIAAMAKNLQDMFVNEIAGIAGTGTSAVSALLGMGNEAAITTITTDAAKLADDVKGVFDSKVVDMVKAGDALIRGVIKGMKDAKQDLIDAAEAIAKAAVAAASGAMKPPAPAVNTGSTSPYGDGLQSAGRGGVVVNVTVNGGGAGVGEAVGNGVLRALRAAGVA